MAAALATSAVASADWHVITPNIGTICTGVDFVSNTTGYLPVDANGVGTEILRTDDGGKTWKQAKAEPFALLLLDITAYKDYVAVVGPLAMEYSLNKGIDFNSSLAQPGAGQCIRNVGPIGQEIGFAAVGQWGLLTEANGVEVSYDAGITFQTVNTSLTASARYGAFPDDKTWFVAAGDWPGEGADDQPVDDNPPVEGQRTSVFARYNSIVEPAHYVNAVPEGSRLVKMQSARIHLLKTPSGKLMYAQVKKAFFVPAVTGGSGNTTTWDAQVGKTADGGKTWSTVFSRLTSTYYFNGIECWDTNECCVVGESGAGTTGGGTFIWCTSDGGNTWAETLIDLDDESSLTDIAAIGPSEYWAVGGEFAWYGVQFPVFVHTTDAGKTWETINGTSMALQYAIAVDCVPADGTSAGNCYAALLDVDTQESSIAALN